jgi:hypothetical protein
MKYLYIVLIGTVFINCSYNSVEETTTSTPVPQKVEVVVSEPVKMGAVEVVETASVTDKTLVADERKIIKNIKSDVPSECTMWSDGCNVCTRTNSKKASCTTYPECHNRTVSCLKWN